MDLFKKYILTDGELVETNDILEWAESFESMDWIIAKTEIEDVEVSTVLLSIGSYSGYYETMIFGGDLDGEQDRYTTKEAAIEGHRKFVKRVELSLKLESSWIYSLLQITILVTKILSSTANAPFSLTKKWTAN